MSDSHDVNTRSVATAIGIKRNNLLLLCPQKTAIIAGKNDTAKGRNWLKGNSMKSCAVTRVSFSKASSQLGGLDAPVNSDSNFSVDRTLDLNRQRSNSYNNSCHASQSGAT